MARLDGRAAIVTGSGDGIGRAIALAFAREGASVVAVDVKAAGVAETVRQIEAEAAPGRALGLARDISRADAIEETVDACVARFGRLDCLVNNAALQEWAALEDITEEHWDRVQAVNVRAAMLFAQKALAPLAAQPGGSIVNIASLIADLPMPGRLAYSTSKAAVIGLTRALAAELGGRGIRVNAISPGHVMSSGEDRWRERFSPREQEVMILPYPLGRVGRPEEIARVAVFLASDDASFLTGHTVYADGGMGVLSPETIAFRVAGLS